MKKKLRGYYKRGLVLVKVVENKTQNFISKEKSKFETVPPVNSLIASAKASIDSISRLLVGSS